MSIEYGLIMAADNPYPIANVRKVELITSLFGRPKDTFETPREV